MTFKRSCIILASIAIFAMVCGPVMAEDTIKIAYIDPLTGGFADVGEAGHKHFQYMADLINAKGGVLGKKIEIVAFDSKINPKEALIQLKSAIDQGIHYIAHGNSSAVAGALIGAVNKHNKRNPDNLVVYLNYAAVTPKFTNEMCSFWHFRFDAHVEMKMAAITDSIAADKSIKKIYLINQDYVFGHSVRDVALAMLKEKRPDIEIVGNTLHPTIKVKDFSPYIAKIQASGADAIITGNWGADMSLLIKAGKDAGLDVQYFTFYAGGLGTPVAVGEAGENRVKQVTEWHSALCIEEKQPEDEKFYLGYDEKYSDDGNQSFYYGRVRTVMEMFVKALNKAGKDDAKAFAFALEGMEHETLYGKVTMRAEDHQLIQPLYISTMVKAGQDGVKYDVDNTGMGWKTNFRVEAADTAMPTNCKMKRPEK
jgi:branched-chain amino acid transport system substrate-binding protein